MVALAVLVALALPALVYSHLLSTSSKDSRYMAKPDDISTWETFESAVAASCATLDNSDACHPHMPFPERRNGAFLIRVTGCSSH